MPRRPESGYQNYYWCNKPSVIIHKRNCINRTQMLIILLRNFPCINIPLHNLTISHTSQKKNVLLILIRIQLNHIRNLPVEKVCFSRAITMKSYNMFYLFSITPTTLNRISLSSRVDTWQHALGNHLINNPNWQIVLTKDTTIITLLISFSFPSLTWPSSWDTQSGQWGVLVHEVQTCFFSVRL